MFEYVSRHRVKLWCLAIAFIAFLPRFWMLEDSGIQNDEQIWHERSARFAVSFLGPFQPQTINIPQVYWPRDHVDLSAGHSWPLNIVMPTIHPGSPAAFLMGFCYLFLAKDAGSWSLNLDSMIVTTRYPAVVLGVILVVAVFLIAHALFGLEIAIFAGLIAGVEPLLIGNSRLARIDLSAATWAALSVYFFIRAQQRGKILPSCLSGIFAGLALATNPYGLFLLPVLLSIKLILNQRTDALLSRLAAKLPVLNQPYVHAALPDRLDVAGLLVFVAAYIVAYPNLWPNPLQGMFEIIKLNANLPHFKGEAAANMPTSHLVYLTRSTLHVLPWTLLLYCAGIVSYFYCKALRKPLLLIFLWGFIVLALLSAPAGRKDLKNFLLVMPSLCILAGAGAVFIARKLQRRLPSIDARDLKKSVAAIIVAGGIAGTAYSWPYPQLFTWPFVPDPQTMKRIELVATGEGVKEAVEYIKQRGGGQLPSIGVNSGMNNLLYYYPKERAGYVYSERQIYAYDWVIYLPKIVFTTSATHEDPYVRWMKTREPTHVIRLRQVELVRLYETRRYR